MVATSTSRGCGEIEPHPQPGFFLIFILGRGKHEMILGLGSGGTGLETEIRQSVTRKKLE